VIRRIGAHNGVVREISTIFVCEFPVALRIASLDWDGELLNNHASRSETRKLTNQASYDINPRYHAPILAASNRVASGRHSAFNPSEILHRWIAGVLPYPREQPQELFCNDREEEVGRGAVY